MKTLEELRVKLYDQYYADVQLEFGSFADVMSLLGAYIEKKYATRFSKMTDLKMQEFWLKEWYESESCKMRFMNTQQRMGMIFVDDSLIKVLDASSEIFKIAFEKRSVGDVPFEKTLHAQDLLEEIQKQIELVAEFNRAIADQELSESLIDVNYIIGLSEHCSMRMKNRLRYEH